MNLGLTLMLRRRAVSGQGGGGGALSNLDASGAPYSLSFDASIAGTVNWRLDAASDLTAVEVNAGGGEASGSFAVAAGGVLASLDFASTLDGTYTLYFAMGESLLSTEVTFTTAAFELMGAVGDFDDAAGWTFNKSGMSVSGGVLDINTTANFTDAVRSGGNRLAAAPGLTLDLEFNMVALTAAQRLRIFLRSYDAGGATIDASTTVFDSNADGTVTLGLNQKSSVYTTPAGTATVQVSVQATIAGFVGQMGHIRFPEAA